MGNRTKYSEDEQAQALAALDANGGLDTRGALTKTAEQTGIPTSTLYGWATGRNNPVSSQLRNEKMADLRDLVEAELRAIFGVLPAKRDEAGYKDLNIALGILFDKLSNLDGQPTQHSEITLHVERSGLSTLPAHLAPGAGAGGEES